MALSYYIWCFAKPRGWDVTLNELADACAVYFIDADISIPVIKAICQSRSKDGTTWLALLRRTSPRGNAFNYVREV